MNGAEVAEKLNALHALLENWNGLKGFVSRHDFGALWPRHVEDSLQMVPLIGPEARRAIDIGSGAGFPGLVVAIAAGIHVDLFESNKQKAAFLREAIRVTAANATVHAMRIEDSRLPPAALITARGVSALPLLLASAVPKLAEDGCCLFHKGAGFETEIAAARRVWDMDVTRIPSRTGEGAVILRLSGLRRR
ncbi:MAG: 16S rRNA (guanine(527)-N(7))-methyltransferase RsmG [Rhodospirillales bacterium]